ncbi:BppU family phage baseplate upper protein [Listeria kieliensis]
MLREIDMTLDLDRKQYIFPDLEMMQGDNLSLKINVSVMQAGEFVDLSGYNITFFTLLPGTKEFVLDADNITTTADGLQQGKFSYIFPAQANQVAGNYVTARFNIVGADGTEISKTARFQYRVEADAAEEATEAATWISSFEKILQAIQEMNQKFNDAVAEINEAILNAQNTQKELESEMQALRDEIAKSGYVSKTGDSMTGTLNLDAQEALNVRYGAIKHYVGSNLASGTKIVFSVGSESTNHLPENTLTFVVGGEAVGDSRFAITEYRSGYVYGYAPADYSWGKSVVNDGSPVTAKTITPTNALAIVRDGEIVQLYGKQLTVNADTTVNGTFTTWGVQANGFVKIGKENAETEKGAQTKADKALTDAKNYFDTSLTVQKVTLTPKNGFTASRTLTASYVKMGNRYWVSISGIVAKGTGNGTGICATVPAMLQPDTNWNKLYSAAQQSTAASNHANIYLSSGGDINIVAVGAADVNTGLDGITYFTKEVTA